MEGALAWRGVLGFSSVAAGSGFVVKPWVSWALVGDGGPLDLGGPTTQPTENSGMTAIWEIRKFQGSTVLHIEK